jgi:hypothetical protein
MTTAQRDEVIPPRSHAQMLSVDRMRVSLIFRKKDPASFATSANQAFKSALVKGSHIPNVTKRLNEWSMDSSAVIYEVSHYFRR